MHFPRQIMTSLILQGVLISLILLETYPFRLMSVPHRRHLSSSRLSRLHVLNEDSSSSFDVEAARRQLEDLVGGPTSTSTDTNENGHPPRTDNDVLTELKNLRFPPPSPPLLTSIDRERRLAEMELLAQLDEGDEAMTDLWSLWFNERGPEAAEKLERVEELTGQGPAYWPQAEDILLDLVAEYGVYFTEPVNRLATLYYLQDRLEESERLCSIVLHVKPWHFGALSGIVMVHAGLRNVNAARLWASRRLPPFHDQRTSTTIDRPEDSNKQRRHGWVIRAVRDAQQSLSDAENRVRQSFGEPDDHSRNDRKSIQPSTGTDEKAQDVDGTDDEDSWQ